MKKIKIKLKNKLVKLDSTVFFARLIIDSSGQVKIITPKLY